MIANSESTVCTNCMKNKDIVLIEHDVIPELVCAFCEKGESELLSQGRPCCNNCYRKNKSPTKLKVMQSQLGNSSPLNSVLSYRTTKNSESKLSKKIEALLKEFRNSQASSMKKKALLYYAAKETSKITWSGFIEKCEKKYPLAFLTTVGDRVIGAFLNDPIESGRPKTVDPQCGILECSKNGLLMSGIQGNKIWFENKTIHFGDPESLRIHFDVMKLNSELLESSDSIDLENLYIFKL